jgi:hypothetical protein
VDALFPLLLGAGFRKRAGDVLTLDLAPGVLGWLGLNRASQHRAPGEVEINPVVGVRFQDVERLVAACRGDKFHPYQPPTISSPIGYLMPDKKYKGWLFGPGRSNDDTAADVARAIDAYGVPFMRSVVDLDELRQRLEGRMGIEDQLVYRRPVAAFLAGDVGRARALLDDALAAIGLRSDLAAADFKNFGRALHRRLTD